MNRIFLLLIVLAAAVALVASGLGGWTWDTHPTAGTVIVVSHESGMADGNG